MTDTVTDAAGAETPAFDPRVMLGVIPYVSMPDRAGEAADFYVKAFGARDIGRHTDPESGKIMHVQLEINGGALMMSGMTCEESGARTPQGFHLQLVVANGQEWWDRAVAAGCAVTMPFEPMFWGDRWGMLRDPFGLEWAVNEPGARS